MMQRTSKITDTVEDLKLAFRVFVIFFFNLYPNNINILKIKFKIIYKRIKMITDTFILVSIY